MASMMGVKPQGQDAGEHAAAEGKDLADRADRCR